VLLAPALPPPLSSRPDEPIDPLPQPMKALPSAKDAATTTHRVIGFFICEAPFSTAPRLQRDRDRSATWPLSEAQLRKRAVKK
jgi:hypothetical protein